MKNFIKKHKKACIIGGILVLLFLIFFIVVFIAPLFSNDKYGDRLEGIEDHEVTDDMVNTVTEALEENEGVTNVSYHNEGRILNFIVTIEADVELDSAKSYAEDITDNLSDDIKDYYDIEVFFTTEEDSDIYPTIGYHHKGAEEFSWSNVGESSE